MCFLRTSQCFGWHAPNISLNMRGTTFRHPRQRETTHPMKKMILLNLPLTPLLSVGMRQYAGLPSDSDELGEAGIVVMEETASSPN